MFCQTVKSTIRTLWHHPTYLTTIKCLLDLKQSMKKIIKHTLCTIDDFTIDDDDSNIKNINEKKEKDLNDLDMISTDSINDTDEIQTHMTSLIIIMVIMMVIVIPWIDVHPNWWENTRIVWVLQMIYHLFLVKHIHLLKTSQMNLIQMFLIFLHQLHQALII